MSLIHTKKYLFIFQHDFNKPEMGRSSGDQPDPAWTIIAYIVSFVFGICFWLGVGYLLFCYL